MSDPATDALAEAVRGAARILSRRALLLIGMGLDFVLFIWTCIQPDFMHLAAAGGFGALVLIASVLPSQ